MVSHFIYIYIYIYRIYNLVGLRLFNFLPNNSLAKKKSKKKKRWTHDKKLDSN